MTVGSFDDLQQSCPQGVQIGKAQAIVADPPDPPEGTFCIWMSLGSDAQGDNGDVLIKATSGGVTKTAILLNFSAA